MAGNRLSLTGAFFRTENKNVIFVVDPAAVPPIFNQDDGQQVNGVALGAVGRITPRWDVNVSVAVSRLGGEEPERRPTTGGGCTLTPEFSGSIWTTVRLPHDIRIGGGVRYTEAVFVNAANTIASRATRVADALVEAPLGQRLTLRLNIYNVTDKVYIRNINNNGGRYNPGNAAIVPAEQRGPLLIGVVERIDAAARSQRPHARAGGRGRQLLANAQWVDGRVTAGPQSSRAKHNQQLPEDSPEARELGEMILGALQRSPLFMSAALPLKVFPPLFNRYAGGHSFGSHVDNAIRQVPGTPHRMRTDLSATLFLHRARGLRRRRAASSRTPTACTR